MERLCAWENDYTCGTTSCKPFLGGLTVWQVASSILMMKRTILALTHPLLCSSPLFQAEIRRPVLRRPHPVVTHPYPWSIHLVQTGVTWRLLPRPLPVRRVEKEFGWRTPRNDRIDEEERWGYHENSRRHYQPRNRYRWCRQTIPGRHRTWYEKFAPTHKKTTAEQNPHCFIGSWNWSPRCLFMPSHHGSYFPASFRPNKQRFKPKNRRPGRGWWESPVVIFECLFSSFFKISYIWFTASKPNNEQPT